MRFCPYGIVLAGFAAILAGRAASQDNPAASSSSSKNQKAAHAAAKSAKPAPDISPEQNSYRNSTFGFRYNVIVGWVNRTQQMQPEATQTGEADATSNQVLLAVFERPPEAIGETVNSAIVIAEESAATYPGLKTPADYVGPLTELVTSKGFKAAGEAYEVTVDLKPLVRCDFTREFNKLTMFQSTLVMLQKGTLVSFTFIGGSQDEVDALIERLSFSRGAAAKPR